jgi:hypothetical protein
VSTLAEFQQRLWVLVAGEAVRVPQELSELEQKQWSKGRQNNVENRAKMKIWWRIAESKCKSARQKVFY